MFLSSLHEQVLCAWVRRPCPGVLPRTSATAGAPLWATPLWARERLGGRASLGRMNASTCPLVKVLFLAPVRFPGLIQGDTCLPCFLPGPYTHGTFANHLRGQHPVGIPSISLASPIALPTDPFYRCIDVESGMLRTCPRALVASIRACMHFVFSGDSSLSVAHPCYGASSCSC